MHLLLLLQLVLSTKLVIAYSPGLPRLKQSNNLFDFQLSSIKPGKISKKSPNTDLYAYTPSADRAPFDNNQLTTDIQCESAYNDLDQDIFERDISLQIYQLESLIEEGEKLTTSTIDIEEYKSKFAQNLLQIQSKMYSDVWKARFLLLVSAALYGTNFTMVKIMNESIPAEIGTSLRFALGAAATLPWLLRPSSTKDSQNAKILLTDDLENQTALGTSKQQLDKVQERPIIDDVVLGSLLAGFEIGIWNTLGYLSQSVGLQTTAASTSAFICALTVVMVPALDFLSGKHIRGREIIGSVMAVAGVGFLEMDAISLTDGSISTGELLSLFQPLAFGMGFWRMEHAMRKFPTEASRLTAAQLFAIFISSSVYCLYTLGGFSGLPNASQFYLWLSDPMIIGAFFWTGIITTALTVYMETLALKTLSAAETTMIFSTEPLFGGAFAAVTLGETFGIGGYIGGVMILFGCIFSNIGFDFESNET